MIDRNYIGKEFGRLTVAVEAGQLAFFAKAVGETNPIYSDEAAALAAGHKALPAPPTFGFSLMLAAPDPFAWLAELGVELGRILHGEQKFEYGAQIYAGERITLISRLSDIYDKKGGALEFLCRETRAVNEAGEEAVRMSDVIVVRNG